MTIPTQRVNYDLIAHLYDEPGRDYDTDPILVSFLEEKAEYPHTLIRILDMGCGTGKQLFANSKKFPELSIVGLDLFHGMLMQANQRSADIEWVQGDNVNPPFSSNSFDYITNQFSYHHVQNKIGMIAEIYRILKPGGRFAITNLDPWSMPNWIVYKYFPASQKRDFVDFLRADILASIMQVAGFIKIQVKRQHIPKEERLSEFLEYASQRHRTSQLIAIADKEYEDGLERLRRDAVKLDGDALISSEICLIWITGDKPGYFSD